MVSAPQYRARGLDLTPLNAGRPQNRLARIGGRRMDEKSYVLQRQ